MQHLVYLHGFLSSPASEKAQQTREFVKKHFPYLNVHTPQLPGDIHKAVQKIDALMQTLPQGRIGFIGSSMGGFLSTYFIEKYAHMSDARGVLINPAVKPYILLQDYIGPHINPYTFEAFSIYPKSLSHLHDYAVEKISEPQRYFVMLQTGDETLDYRLALSHYAGATLHVEQGGDHSFQNYDTHLPEIFKFLMR